MELVAEWQCDFVAADYNIEQHATAVKTEFYELQIANNQL